MWRLFGLAAIAVGSALTLSCSARPIRSGELASSEDKAPQPTEIPEHKVNSSVEQVNLDDLKRWNHKAKSPTFGLIREFYQLPSTTMIGAVSIDQAVGLGGSFQSVRIRGTDQKPFAVVPFSSFQSRAFERATQKLLDAQIKLTEISMADAIQVMKAEQKALANKKPLIFRTLLPSGVDLLISTQRGYSEEIGPVYVGRVISTKDGRLLAFITEPDIGSYALEPLLLRLVSDSLRRLAGEK